MKKEKIKKQRRVRIEALREFIQRLLQASGCDHHDASLAADVFLEADLRGNHMQGLDHVYTMVRNLRNGNADPKGKPKVALEGKAYALIEGHRGPGQLAAILAADIAIEKATEAGAAAVGITNSSDIYMLGFYTERIARAGHIGFGFTNGGPFAHAAGGAEPVLGTNPISIAIPTGAKDPLLMDMATSTLSGSRVRFAQHLGDQLPRGSALGPDGRETRLPELARTGGLTPLGGYKGFALSLCVALLCGPLTGSDVGKALDGWGLAGKATGRSGSIGHFFIAIDPAAFNDPAKFRDGVDAYVEEIKNSRKAPGVETIRIPGERAFAERRANLDAGFVSLHGFIWSEAAAMASELGVSMPDTF